MELSVYRDRSVVVLMDDLLAQCADDSGLYAVLLQWPNDLRRRSARLVADLDGMPMSALEDQALDLMAASVREVATTYPHLSAAVGIRVLLNALDALLGETIIDLMELEATDWTYASAHEPTADTPPQSERRIVYTPNPDLRHALAGKPITPRKLRRDGREATCLFFRRVETSEHRCDVTVTFALRSALEAWLTEAELPLIGTLHRNASLGQFDVTFDEAHEGFGPVSPRSSNDDLLRDLLDQAAATGCTIIVLPELSVTEAEEELIAQWFVDQEAVRMVVAGSRHVGEAEGITNRSTIHVKGSADPILHRKLVPFVFRQDDLELQEQIVLGSDLLLLGTRDFTISVVICADLLEPMVVRALSAFGVNFLLVPAMSPVLGLFVSEVGHLVAHNVGFAVVANGPPDWGRRYRAWEVVVGRATDDPCVARFGGESEPAPSSIAVSSLASGTTTWV